jgi:signal transduction histidine kinase
VRNLTMMMAGNVRVHSELGQGSTFTVLLPLIVDNTSSPEPTSTAVAQIEE